MHQRIAQLRAKVAQVGEVREDFEDAVSVSPETLRRETPSAKKWFVCSDEARKNMPPVDKRENYPVAFEALTIYLLERFDEAAAIGIATLVLDEPIWAGGYTFLTEFAKHLEKLGFLAKTGGESRHRHCPHMNGGGDACLYDDDMDGGAGEITPIHLVISLPPLAQAA
jgi:hypothetical protein